MLVNSIGDKIQTIWRLSNSSGVDARTIWALQTKALKAINPGLLFWPGRYCWESPRLAEVMTTLMDHDVLEGI